MSFSQIIISYFFGLLISFVFFYLVGKGVRFLYSKVFIFSYLFADIFFSLVVGQVVIVCVYAILCTKGLTIQWLFLLIAFFFWWERKEELVSFQTKKETPITLKYLLPSIVTLLIGSLFCFAWEALFFLKVSDFPFNLPFVDTPFYSKIAHFLSVTGSENTANMERWFENRPSHGIALYHYFELWLNSFITNCLGLLEMPTYILIVQPLFYLSGLIGILALLERKMTFHFLHLFWAILLLFTSAVFFDFYSKIEKLQYIDIIFFNFLGHLSKKTGTYYVCMLIFALLFEQKRYTQAFYGLFCLPIMTVTMLPAVIGGTWLFLVLSFFLRAFPVKIIRKIGFASTLFFIIYLCLYQLIKDENALFILNHSFSSFEINHLFTKLKLVIGTWGQVFLLFVPYLVVILINNVLNTYKSMYYNHKGIIIALVSILISGTITWALFFNMRDGFQLFSGTLSAISVLFIVLLIQYVAIFSFTKPKMIAINLLLITLLSFNLFSQIKKQKHQYSNSNNYFTRGKPHGEVYLKKIKEKIDNKQIIGFGGCLMDNDLLEKSFYPYQTSLHFIKLGDYLYTMTNQSFVVSMHDLSIGDLDESKAALAHVLPFYRFVEHQKNANTFRDVVRSQIDFIQKYKLKFLILSNKYILTEAFQPLIQEIIIDESSGERFMILKTN
jgi:hypothetical protein